MIFSLFRAFMAGPVAGTGGADEPDTIRNGKQHTTVNPPLPHDCGPMNCITGIPEKKIYNTLEKVKKEVPPPDTGNGWRTRFSKPKREGFPPVAAFSIVPKKPKRLDTNENAYRV